MNNFDLTSANTELLFSIASKILTHLRTEGNIKPLLSQGPEEVYGGYNVQILASFSADSGEALYTKPLAEIYAGDMLISTGAFDPLLSPIWSASFEMLSPKPTAARLVAQFMSSMGAVETISRVIPLPYSP